MRDPVGYWRVEVEVCSSGDLSGCWIMGEVVRVDAAASLNSSSLGSVGETRFNLPGYLAWHL